MSVYKHKNGRWYYKFVIKGQQYHKAIPEAVDKKTAEMAEVRIKSDLLQGKYDLVENKGTQPFSVIVDMFIEYAKNNRTGWKNDMSEVNILKNFFKNTPLKDITPKKIEQYRKFRKDENGVKPATINREVGILRRMFALAIKENMVKENPCLAVNLTPLKVDNIKERFLTKKEEERLLENCTGDFTYLRPIIKCALLTGMRRGEIMELRWSLNVDLKNRCINLLKTKNNKIRKIPICNELMTIFKELKQNAISDYVFTNPVTQTGYKYLSKAFRNVCKKAEITNLTFHGLRHTSATRMVAAGIDLVVVKEILGHADLKTTQRYAHPVPERKLKAIEALENYSD